MLLPISARAVVLQCLPQQAVGAEVGVWKGDFSFELLQATEPTALHLIDPWACAEAGPRRAAWFGADNVTPAEMERIHTGVLSRFERPIGDGQVVVHRRPSAEALSGMADASLDWIYIDGDHSYAGALGDMRLALRKVRPGGIIAGDDYHADGWWKDGVIRALHDFLAEAGGRARILFVLDGQFALVVQ